MRHSVNLSIETFQERSGKYVCSSLQEGRKEGVSHDDAIWINYATPNNTEILLISMHSVRSNLFCHFVLLVYY
jgi:hypothetical protein